MNTSMNCWKYIIYFPGKLQDKTRKSGVGVDTVNEVCLRVAIYKSHEIKKM